MALTSAGGITWRKENAEYKQLVGASAMSSSSCPDSCDSTDSPDSSPLSVSLSPQSMENLLGMSAEEQARLNIDIYPQPCLVVREQPVDKYRFRYKSEMLGSHGCMLGRNSDKRRKYFPSVELMGYNGPAVIRCSLHTAQKNESERTFHCHRLVIKVGKEEKDDPHQICVDNKSGYTAKFQGMGIIHTAKKHITEEIVRKKKMRLLEINKSKNINVTSLTQNEDVQVRTEADAETKNIDLNIVTLCFEAFSYDANKVLVPICPRVFSETIRNMKSALTGELKICRIDRHFSTCVGGDEVWILVEKVGKKNIKVKFFEMDDDDNEVWYDFGKFTELDVHHQYAIVLRTPPYRRMDLTEPKDVLLQLFRPTDGCCSEAIRFTYRPSDKFLGCSRKRPRTAIESLSAVNGFNFATPDPVGSGGAMLSSGLTADDDDILADLETMSVNSITIEEALNDGLDSAEFRQFMQHESFEEVLSTYKMLDLPNDMDLTTDNGSSRQRRDARRQRGAGIVQPPPPPPPPPVDSEVEPFTPGDKLVKFVESRLVDLMSSRPVPPPTIFAARIRELFEKKQDDGDNALHIAMKPKHSAHLNQIISIIRKSRSIDSETLQLYLSDIVLNSRNNNLETPLNRAVFYNRPSTVAALLRFGACPNLPDIEGLTPLHLAVANGYDGCVSELLARSNYAEGSVGPSLDIKSKDGFSPLHAAARNANATSVRLLVGAGADVNERDLTDGRTALHLAVGEESVDIAAFLVARPELTVDERDYAGNTALHVACVVGGSGSAELVKMLVAAGADPSLPNFNTEANDEDPVQSVVKLEPGEPRGQTSFDLASDNAEIMNIFQEAILPEGKIKKEPREDSPLTVPKVEEPTLDNEFFDGETLTKLCKSLNESGGWEQLAQLLDYSSFIESFSFQSSPSRALFTYTEMKGDVTIDQVRDCLSMLEESEAVKVIDDMLARRLAATFS